MKAYLLASLSLAGAVYAQAGNYQQCGGIGFTGPTSCSGGWTCTYSNAYYSQCLPGSGGGNGGTKTTTSAARTTTPAGNNGGGGGLKASFTHYGAGDSFGSPNCQTKTSACGFYTSPGYAAAVSQNLYGAGPGQGAGPACNTCYKITIQTDQNGRAVSNAGNSIVVMVNNLCPAQGNPLCSQNGLSGTNQYGANVNFDLCSDSGASSAFFGNSGVGLALGTAQQVSCSQWSGTIIR
ncbi:hypothetical protein TWF694_000312 [Orbilia ellipsospora]|uniref:CBM1 domain-containing protein n=1 Tax=Orbilia ellipsospora TaxID=2528407 RepID=A0AAV9XNK3_9PEZI